MPIGQIRQKALKPSIEAAPNEPTKTPVATTPFLVTMRVIGQVRHTAGLAFLASCSRKAVFRF